VSERAALYTVAVRPKARGGEALPLGDLADAIAGILDGLSETSPDGTRLVRVLGVRRDGNDVFAVIQHGSRGVAADIVDRAGGVRLRQTPDDLQLVRSGCLFRLPPIATAGTLAVHVSNGRGVKGLFEQGLVARFAAQRADQALRIDRLAEPGALGDAVAGGRVEKIRLVLLEPGGERAVADTDKWIVAGEPARLELDVGAHRTNGRIRSDLLERYLGGDEKALGEIVEFAGLTFDRASVGVRLPDDTRRLFDLAHPDAGRPASRELAGIVLDDAGEPTEASLLAALQAAIGP
jgi:hypothetical protein